MALAKVPSSLIWPVIIAGSHMYDDNRSTVLDVFEAFRFASLYLLAYGILTDLCRVQCCYEVDTAERIVQKVSCELADQVQSLNLSIRFGNDVMRVLGDKNGDR